MDRMGHFALNYFGNKILNLNSFVFQNEPFKVGKKSTLVERAKTLGLEELSLNILRNEPRCTDILINGKRGLSKEETETGIVHILVHAMTTSPEAAQYIREM